MQLITVSRGFKKFCLGYKCDDTPSAPTIHQLLRTHFSLRPVINQWFRQRHRTFLYCYKKYNQGSGRKRTNERYAWVNSSARRELCNTAFPVCICRLTLAWILVKILQRYQECQPILIGLLSLVLDSLMPTRLSAVRCQLVTRVTLRQLQVPFVQLSSRVLLPTSSHPRSRVQNPLSGFAPKQTKESSAWRTTYIVLQHEP